MRAQAWEERLKGNAASVQLADVRALSSRCLHTFLEPQSQAIIVHALHNHLSTVFLVQNLPSARLRLQLSPAKQHSDVYLGLAELQQISQCSTRAWRATGELIQAVAEKKAL